MRASLRNLYLIVGIWGDFQLRAQRVPGSVEVALSHTLDSWGISPVPWGACDSGADLETPGPDVLRGWNHVDLRVSGDDEGVKDVPIAGLLRTTWDALELFGATALTRVDAIVPTECATETTWQRVAGSVVRDSDRRAGQPAQVLVQIGGASRASAAIAWSEFAIAETLSALVDLANIAEGEDFTDRSSAKPQLFGRHAADSFRAGATLPQWTIDDAAWLAEAVSAACRRAGIRRDIQVTVSSSQT